jgi:hypothetical protein
LPYQCETKGYTKSDGTCACGFLLESTGLIVYYAYSECRNKNGQLPEIYSTEDNAAILAAWKELIVMIS